MPHLCLLRICKFWRWLSREKMQNLFTPNLFKGLYYFFITLWFGQILKSLTVYFDLSFNPKKSIWYVNCNHFWSNIRYIEERWQTVTFVSDINSKVLKSNLKYFRIMQKNSAWILNSTGVNLNSRMIWNRLPFIWFHL